MSHLLQKPIESLCGFLTVLPGAFSAFRWEAVEVCAPCSPHAHFPRTCRVLTGRQQVCCSNDCKYGSQGFRSAQAAPVFLPARCSISMLQLLPPNYPTHPTPPAQGEPLRRYFHGLYSQAELNAFEANMYLAEDRVLCLEIVAKKGSAYRWGRAVREGLGVGSSRAGGLAQVWAWTLPGWLLSASCSTN